MSEWNPDDPTLKGLAPHEPSAVLRWHKAHVPSKKIMRMLRLRGTQLIKQIEIATEKEREAERIGRPVHNALMPKEAQSE